MAGSSPSHYATWLQALQRFSILKKKTALPNIFDKYFRCKIQDGGLAVVNNQEHGQGVLTRSFKNVRMVRSGERANKFQIGKRQHSVLSCGTSTFEAESSRLLLKYRS
jgi:hypothetical protein